jgi:hypothetical protein
LVSTNYNYKTRYLTNVYLYHYELIDTDGSGQLSADELQRALINGDWSPFNIETVRLMVNMFDTGRLLKEKKKKETWQRKFNILLL